MQIIDDDEAVRASLRLLLLSAGLQAQTYATGAEFLKRMQHPPPLPPGCVVTDLRMPEVSGMQLVRRMKESGLSHPIIVITGHGEVAVAVEAMKAGVVEFLEKPFDDEQFLAAVRAALDLSSETMRLADEKRRTASLFATLSERERQVLSRLLEGKSNKIIARELNIGPRTVEVYRANVMQKTGASGLTELVQLAILAEFWGAGRLRPHR